MGVEGSRVVLVKNKLITCLDGRGVKRSRVEGERDWLNYLVWMFFKGGERDLEGFGGILTTSNPSFLIPQNLRDLEEG